MLEINTTSNAPSNVVEKSSQPLDDGDGKYTLVGVTSHMIIGSGH